MLTHCQYIFLRFLDESILNMGYLCLIELLFVGTVIAVHFYYHCPLGCGTVYKLLGERLIVLTLLQCLTIALCNSYKHE